MVRETGIIQVSPSRSKTSLPIGNEKDICRDILHFVTAYLPVKFELNLPEALPHRLINSENRQAVRGNLHVVAHSMGAQASLLAAAHAPDVFASLSIFDPAIVPPGDILNNFCKLPNEVFCTNLPEVLPSREVLRRAIEANRRLRGWDQRVVDVFVRCGAMDDAETGGVRLTAPPRLEWALYYDKETPTQTYERIRDIRTPINAVMPARPFATPAGMFENLLKALPQRTQVTWLPQTSHQVVYERVDECAEHVCNWLTSYQDQDPESDGYKANL